MKKILALVLTACMFCTLALSISAETLSSTLIRSSAADPWLCKYEDFYYLTVTGSTKIAVFRSKTIAGFAAQGINSNIVYDSSRDATVQELFGAGATLSGTWSPELHYFSEEEAPGNSGWYMLLALRNSTGDSSEIQMVVLKSTTDTPKGPYGHPITGEKNRSQPVLNADGTRYTDWGCGMSSLTIPEGPYKGIYTTWVTEVGRGEGLGNFYQKIMIAKMINPWTIGSEPGVVTTPTQSWEYKGSSATHPRVVEGATALYGTRGDVYITYAGSGYWSDYGIGQLTWSGGDPLKTESWVKLPDRPSADAATYNPVFQANKSFGLVGAGHASFITDENGNGFLCYHSYSYVGGKKSDGRSAYIEPYYIDYTQWNGTSYGVLRMGANDNRQAAVVSMTAVDFATTGEALGTATIKAVPTDTSIKLTLTANAATGYALYRSTDGKVFDYLTNVEGGFYEDKDVVKDGTYYYRAYSTREEQVGEPSKIVSATVGAAAIGVELKMTLGKTEYTVNGETKTMDVAPIIRNDRTMLPVRYVGEALGAEIVWDGATSTATLKTADTEIKITVGASEAVVNGKAVTLDSPAFIEQSRTYMPVRFVAETLGATVAWDGATSTATITK